MPKKIIEDKEDSNESKYPSGWDDEDVKRGLALIGAYGADKTARDNQNQMINEVLAEASLVSEPIRPRFVGAKRLKQAVTKTAERITVPKWTLQGDGATEDEEIIVTKAVKEVLHRAGYDWTFTGKGGIIDGILRYGDKYRMFVPTDSTKTSIPFKFQTVDGNNLFMSTEATSFRHGNKIVTQLVALFRGTIREFEEQFPEYEGQIKPGYIPRKFSFKDLDQTRTQRFRQSMASAEDAEDSLETEWAYMFDIHKKTFCFVAGGDLAVLDKKEGKKYPWVFKNIEGKEEPYIPVSNFICLPSEEGIYNVGLVAYLYDHGITFRRVLNMIIGHVEENTWPDTLVNIPQGQEGAFFQLKDMANQMRAQGQMAYIPITYNPSSPGQISSAQPILNGGDINGAQALMAIIDDEFRKCGVYLDEPLNADLTEQQIALQASNATTLPKAIMKYNAPEIEFEIMAALDLLKKGLSKDDKAPLIMDTTIDFSDGKRSVRGVPYSYGWLKEKLLERAWRPQLDPESGAQMSNNMLISLYKSILPTMQPGTPEYQAIAEKITLLSGVSIPKSNPNMAAAGPAMKPPGQMPFGPMQPPTSGNPAILGGIATK